MNNNDLQLAKQNLGGSTLVAVRDGNVVATSDLHGIAPMMRLYDDGANLTGAAVADVVVGKAVAMLFVATGVTAVYGSNMSVAGRDYLVAHGVCVEYGTLCPYIINRTGDGFCPMEQAVSDTDDPTEGIALLKATIKRLSAAHR